MSLSGQRLVERTMPVVTQVRSEVSEGEAEGKSYGDLGSGVEARDHGELTGVLDRRRIIGVPYKRGQEAGIHHPV